MLCSSSDCSSMLCSSSDPTSSETSTGAFGPRVAKQTHLVERQPAIPFPAQRPLGNPVEDRMEPVFEFAVGYCLGLDR
jgi:hypothetical protein